MSYILDALKKAEAERKLGSVPDVHAQPVASSTAKGEGGLWSRPRRWGALLASLVILAVLVWTGSWRTGISPITQPLQSAPPVPKFVAIPTSPTPEERAPLAHEATISSVTKIPVVPATPRSSGLPAAAAVPATVSTPIASGAEPVKPHSGSSLANKSAEIRAPEPVSRSGTPPLNKVEVSTQVMPAPEIRVPALNELPAMIQKEIPALTFGGYLYSNSPADRTVLINNRLLHEGDQVSPGLTLEKMMPKEAILNYLGHRYRVSY